MILTQLIQYTTIGGGAALFAFATSPIVRAADFSWNNSAGGFFQTSSNWTNFDDPPLIGPPGVDDLAIFDLSSLGYTVTFGSNVQNQNLFIGNDSVTLNLGSNIYNLTDDILLGRNAGDVALLELLNGNLSSTFAGIGNDSNSTGILKILNGSQLTSVFSNIARDSNSLGQLLVSGTGSIWTLTGTSGEVLEIGLGAGSQGNLTIDNGGTVINNGQTRVGEGGTGTILVTGAGSLWSNAGRILLGAYSGTGLMNVEAGGRVESQFGIISGDRSDSTGTGEATISGNGSTWANNEFLTVGESRQGSLLIENGGLVSNTFALIGLSSTGAGTVTVTDSGSTWNNSQYLDIGISGNGILNILNGGLVSSVGSTLAVEAGSLGQVTVNGNNSTWNNSGDLTVGRSGNAILEILAGGKVENTSATVGQENGSTGTVTVDGNGSLWNLTDLFTIGDRGQGTVTVQNGGTINSNGLARLGDSNFGVGTVTVDGSGSKWTNASGELFIGNYGKGTLNISNQGLVDFQGNDGNARIGIVSASGGFLNISSGGGLKLGGDAVIGAGGNGIVTVEGNESSWEIAKFLAVGESTGSGGNLYILNGGQVTNTTYSSIGVNSGSSGTVIVDGTDSTWINSGDLVVGDRGYGLLNLLNGGLVTSVGSTLGVETGSLGIAKVDGTGSQWNNSGDLIVGRSGRGDLQVLNGGQVTSQGTARIAENSTGIGIIEVRGSGSSSSWTHSGELLIGLSGNGQLVITNGSQVNSDSGSIAVNPGSRGEVLVSGFGAAWNNTGDVEVGLGGIGTLIVNDGIVTADTLSIGPNGTLYGSNGTITANVINAGGVVSPGFSPGKLFINGDYTQNSGILLLEIGGTTPDLYDQLAVTGNVFLDGTLKLNFLNDFLPQTGNEFLNLITGANFSGNFANVEITGIASGWQYQTFFNPTGGLSIRSLSNAQSTTSVPEPGSIASLVSILAGFGLLRRRNPKHFPGKIR